LLGIEWEIKKNYMATQWISPTWRMPENSNQSKFENYSLETDSGYNYIKTNLTTPLTTGEWYNIVCTYDGSQAGDTDKAKVYVNGVEAIYDTGLGTIPATTSASTGPFNIGQWELGGSNRFFNGEIGQVSVYSSTLTSAQVTALYNSGTPVNPMALTPLPVAYYPLGGGSTGDAAVSSPASLTVPNESVPSATVFDFDGASSQYVSTAFNGTGTGDSVFGLQGDLDLTLSFWFYRKSSAVLTGLFNWDDVLGSGSPFFLVQQNLDNLRVFWDGGYKSGTQVTAQNEWNHVVITRTASDNTLRGYLNGNTTPWFSYDDSGTPNLQNIATNIWFGNAYNAYFTGEMANGQIWNTALSAANVTTLYNNGVPLYTGTQPEAANLQLWYKLNVDTSTWDGTNWTIGDSTANYSTALDFPGLNQRIGLASAADLGINSTISVWLNSDNQFFSLVNDVVLGYNLEYPLYINNNLIYVNIAGVLKSFTPNSKVAGRWYNITIVRTGDSVEVFQDGQSLGTQTGYGTAVNTYLNYIGSRQSGGFAWGGKLSNVSVFNSSLSSAQVETIYNNGTPEVSISHSPTGWWKLDNTTTGIQDSVGSNNGTITGSVTQVDSFVSTLNGTSDGMTTANLVTSDLTRSIPYSSYSIDLDYASNDYIDCGVDSDFSFGTGDFTWSIWLNCESHNDYAGIFYTGAGSGDTYRLKFQANGSQDIYLDTSVTDALIADLGAPIAGTGWHHLCIVRTSGTIKTYLDTVEKGSVSRAEAMDNASSKFFIGFNTATYTFDGMFSNIAIWKSALSEDQILSIYNGGVPNNISSLSPLTWWSFSGDSYFNGTNFIFPDLGTGANNGTSTNMGGNELIGNGPGSVANGIGSGMNIPANLRGDAPNSTSNAFSINMIPPDRTTDVPPTP
jgi:hypothetical protein